MPTLRPTPAGSWSTKTKAVTVTLPSGNVATICAGLKMHSILRLGRLPDALTPTVVRYFNLDGSDATAPAQSVEDVRGIYQFMEEICRASFVSPVVVDENPGRDEIALDDLDEADVSFVFRWAMRPVHELERFLAEQEAAVEAVDAQSDDPPSAEPVATPDGVAG